MEETKKENTNTEVVSEVKAETPVPEVSQETKIENNTDNQTNITSATDTTATNANATTTNTNNTTEETNTNVSPLYSRWKTFSFSKVLENVKKQVSII